MGMCDRMIMWGCSKGLDGIEKQIQKVIKRKRLTFLNDDKVLFINKKGKQMEYTFDKMASEAIDIGGWANSMAELGLTHQDVKDILMREYEKQKKEVK